VRRDGRVIYRVADGGVVTDEARNIRVDQVTAGATLLALSLAAEDSGAGRWSRAGPANSGLKQRCSRAATGSTSPFRIKILTDSASRPATL